MIRDLPDHAEMKHLTMGYHVSSIAFMNYMVKMGKTNSTVILAR
jgi:hypothetical protein